MALLDQAREAAFALAKQTLTRGAVADAVNRVEPIVRRQVTLGGNAPFIPRTIPGSRDPLAAARARPDPLLSFNWYCDMPSMGPVELPWSYVEEATLPFIELDQISNYQAGKMKHYPHHYSIGTLSLKLYEDSEGRTAQYLDQWRRRILDPESGLFYLPKDFKQTISITVLDATKATVMFLEYTGCWPMRNDAYGMNSGSSERIAPSVEFSVDELRCKFGKFSPGQVPSVINNVGVDYPPQVSSLLTEFPGSYAAIDFGQFI